MKIILLNHVIKKLFFFSFANKVVAFTPETLMDIFLVFFLISSHPEVFFPMLCSYSSIPSENTLEFCFVLVFFART